MERGRSADARATRDADPARGTSPAEAATAMRRNSNLPPLTFLALLACAPACASRPSDVGVDATRTSTTSSALTASITEVTSFGTNPGALKMFVHVPPSLPAGAPMVLVLHGCAQGATDMATTGWTWAPKSATLLKVK